MALIDDVKVAYRAVVRADLNDTVAAAVATSITNGTTTLDAYIASLVNQNATTTGASVAIAAFVTGKAPTSAKLDDLKKAADAQVASYTAMKVANPQLGAFEAFGKGFAEDAATGFGTKYGALSNADFINTVYASVMGELPSAGAFANLSSQIDFFTKLYTDAKLANPALLAKGAVLGQIVGYAFIDPTFAAKATLDNNVAAVLTAAAKGDTTVYDKALPNTPNQGNVGVTITLIAGTEGVGLNSADPAFKSTNNADTINGPFTTAKIDGAGGEDTANLQVGAALVVGTGQLVSVETVNVTATAAAASLDMDKATGYKAVGVVDGVAGAAVAFTNLAAGTTLSVTDTSPTAAPWIASATFALKDASGLADVANLTVNGIGNASNVVLTGYETVNLTVSGANSTAGGGFALTDANLKALNITASKDATIALTAAALDTVVGTGSGAVTLTGVSNTTKSLDFSAASGNISVAAVGTGAATVKGGSGNDTFGGITANKAVVTAGAGNDNVTFTQAAGTDTATFTGGTGGDTVDLGASKVTSVYTAAGESTLANIDRVTNFTTGNDKFDLKGLALAGDKTNLGNFSANALVDQGDYFNARAVSYGQDTNSGKWYLLADADNDGKFDLATDLAVEIVGGAAGSVVFGDLVLS